jgi:hypothetical protein
MMKKKKRNSWFYAGRQIIMTEETSRLDMPLTPVLNDLIDYSRLYPKRKVVTFYVICYLSVFYKIRKDDDRRRDNCFISAMLAPSFSTV